MTFIDAAADDAILLTPHNGLLALLLKIAVHGSRLKKGHVTQNVEKNA